MRIFIYLYNRYTVVRSSSCFGVSGHAKQRNFSSVVLKMNNDQEESVSSAVYGVNMIQAQTLLF